jgi:hypothetical protein
VDTMSELCDISFYLDTTLINLTLKLDNLNSQFAQQQDSILSLQTDIRKQNTSIILMHQYFMEVVKDFKQHVMVLNQGSHGTHTTSISPPAATSAPWQWGGQWFMMSKSFGITPPVLNGQPRITTYLSHRLPQLSTPTSYYPAQTSANRHQSASVTTHKINTYKQT